MSDVLAVSAENVSKQFVLQRNRADSLRELTGGLFRKPTGGVGKGDLFHALSDISFSIERGETVGIVGHNGSGKSTLLKMLTGILKPTSGCVRTRGRIGALIEVGAGFHPDLSGRENVYLNGSIMGLTRRELTARFDEIVAFAGLERFIDTPVKRYSSGMFMRLGFAIATNIEPDILLIDEVLAVGDTQFQNKCIKRLREFSKNGGTVVFVSHAMGQVAMLCERCLWLDRGRLLHDGPTKDAIKQYMALVSEREEEDLKRDDPLMWEVREQERRAEHEQRESERAEAEAREAEAAASREALGADSRRGRIVSARLRDDQNRARATYEIGDTLRVEVTYRHAEVPVKPVVGVDLFRVDGLPQHAFTVSNYDHGVDFPAVAGEVTVTLTLGPLALMGGEYRVQINLTSDSTLPNWWDHPDDTIADMARFTVVAPIHSPGVAYMASRWQVQT